MERRRGFPLPLFLPLTPDAIRKAMMKNASRVLLRWVPAVVWMVLIFSASTDAMSNQHTSRFFEPFFRWLIPGISNETLQWLHLLFRKGGHVTEYAVLGSLLWWALGASSAAWQARRRPVLALLLAALYAASDEFHQSFIPSRGAAVTDVLIDCTGAALALTAITLLAAIRSRRDATGKASGLDPAGGENAPALPK